MKHKCPNCLEKFQLEPHSICTAIDGRRAIHMDSGINVAFVSIADGSSEEHPRCPECGLVDTDTVLEAE